MSEDKKNLNETNTPEPKIIEVETNSDSNSNDTANEQTVNAAQDKETKKQAKKLAKAEKNKNKKGGFKALLKSRKAKHGSIAIALVAIVIALVVVLNVVFSLLTSRFPDMSIDLTSSSSFALQNDTIDYVSHLEKDVTVNILTTKKTFEDQGNYYVQAVKLLEKMSSKSNSKIKIKYIDLNSTPTFTSKYENVDWSSKDNIMLVESGDNYKVLTIPDIFEYDESTYSYYGTYSVTGSKVEQGVVTSILNVTTDDKTVVDMIKGNNEEDYSGIKTAFENNAYKVNEVTLATGDIDDDANIVVLFSPAVDLDQTAIDKLSNWLDNDGKYGKSLIYTPPVQKVDTPNLDKFLKDWGMELSDGVVFESSQNRLISSTSAYAFTIDYTDYYVDGLKNKNIPLVTSSSRAITISDENLAHSLLNTAKTAGIYPFDAGDDWDYKDAIADKELSVAAEGTKTSTDKKTSNVIVFGSDLMFSSDILSYNSFNNSAYFINLVNTISDKEDVGITIESKSMESKELGITDLTLQGLMMWIFVILIPIATLVTGLVIWLRRRNR